MGNRVRQFSMMEPSPSWTAWHSEVSNVAGALTVHADLRPIGDVLDPTSKLALYRIVQEALSNVRRHSGTDSATVWLGRVDGHVVADRPRRKVDRHDGRDLLRPRAGVQRVFVVMTDGHPDDPDAVRKLMTTAIADEMTTREPHDGYLVFQGGVPEIQDLMHESWK